MKDIFIAKIAIAALTISATFYLFGGIIWSEHFLNAGIVFILLAVIVGFIEQIKGDKK